MPHPASGLALMRHGIRRLRAHPGFRAILVLYLLASVFLVTLHQHHGAAYGHDCAICAAAQTPVTVPHASPHINAPLTAVSAIPIASDRWHESEDLGACRSRAPPKA